MNGAPPRGAPRLLLRALRDLCSPQGWTYAVFWRLKPRLNPRGLSQSARGSRAPRQSEESDWSLMWEEEYILPDLQRGNDGDMQGVDYPAIQAAHLKMSHEIANYGEGILGRAASSLECEWVYGGREYSMPSPFTFGALDPHNMNVKHPPSWQEQFRAGIQTIVVIPVPLGVIQLGSLRLMPEGGRFVLLVQEKMAALAQVPGVFLLDKTPIPPHMEALKNGGGPSSALLGGSASALGAAAQAGKPPPSPHNIFYRSQSQPTSPFPIGSEWVEPTAPLPTTAMAEMESSRRLPPLAKVRLIRTRSASALESFAPGEGTNRARGSPFSSPDAGGGAGAQGGTTPPGRLKRRLDSSEGLSPTSISTLGTALAPFSTSDEERRAAERQFRRLAQASDDHNFSPVHLAHRTPSPAKRERTELVLLPPMPPARDYRGGEGSAMDALMPLMQGRLLSILNMHSQGGSIAPPPRMDTQQAVAALQGLAQRRSSAGPSSHNPPQALNQNLNMNLNQNQNLNQRLSLASSQNHASNWNRGGSGDGEFLEGCASPPSHKDLMTQYQERQHSHRRHRSSEEPLRRTLDPPPQPKFRHPENINPNPPPNPTQHLFPPPLNLSAVEAEGNSSLPWDLPFLSPLAHPLEMALLDQLTMEDSQLPHGSGSGGDNLPMYMEGGTSGGKLWGRGDMGWPAAAESSAESGHGTGHLTAGGGMEGGQSGKVEDFDSFLSELDLRVALPSPHPAAKPPIVEEVQNEDLKSSIDTLRTILPGSSNNTLTLSALLQQTVEYITQQRKPDADGPLRQG